jgi:serine/threonine protein kinase
MYEPPEKTIEYSDTHGRARDVWALGCVLLEILVLLTHGFREPAAVDIFEEERMKSTGKEVKAFSRTMGCVNAWFSYLGNLLENGHQSNKGMWVGGDWIEERKMLHWLLGAIRGMLEVNSTERIKSAQASHCLTVGGWSDLKA